MPRHPHPPPISPAALGFKPASGQGRRSRWRLLVPRHCSPAVPEGPSPLPPPASECSVGLPGLGCGVACMLSGQWTGWLWGGMHAVWPVDRLAAGSSVAPSQPLENGSGAGSACVVLLADFPPVLAPAGATPHTALVFVRGGRGPAPPLRAVLPSAAAPGERPPEPVLRLQPSAQVHGADVGRRLRQSVPESLMRGPACCPLAAQGAKGTYAVGAP